MKKLLFIFAVLLTCTALGRTPRFSTSDIVYWDLATKVYVDSTAGSTTGKVDEVSGVATNLTVPNIIWTGANAGTNYLAELTWDATNKVFILTETAE